MNQPTTKSTVSTREPTLLKEFSFNKRLSKWPLSFGRVAMMFALALTLVSNLSAQEEKTQYWQGILDVGAVKLTLKVEITKEDKGHSAIVYSIEQGNAKIPVDKVDVTEKKISLKMHAIKAGFEGKIDKSGEICKGTFTQHGNEFDLKLKRVKPSDNKEGELVEYWKGTVEDDGRKMEMGLKVFRMADDSLTAKFSSYSQGVTDMPVEFEKKGDKYTVKIPSARFVYSGTLNESKEKIAGAIKQGSSVTKLEFNKTSFGDVPKFNRPQEPKAPFPYKSEEVSYKNAKQGTELAGTLTLPPGSGPFPVAITISGSGPADRNESHSEHKPFLVIADHLARQGIAVLRYDDRGVGGSTGEYSGATSADLATDVEAGIEFLKKHPKINAGKLGLIGHSEGGLIAPIVAANRDGVHFIVLLAGTGVNGGVILKSQSTAMMEADGQTEEALEANRKVHDAILSVIEKDPNATHQQIEAAADAFVDSIENEETKQLMEPNAEQLVAMLKSKWVSYFVKHEPAKTLAKVKCHVLAMNGEKDLQVLCDLNLNPIEKALKEGSPASFEVVRLPNVNHMFQETDGTGTPEDYGKIEETFSPKALKIVSEWVKKVTK